MIIRGFGFGVVGVDGGMAAATDNWNCQLESITLTSKQAFINTELYARVCIAVLFYKLGDMAEMTRLQGELYTFHAAAESGKLFLLELLHSVNSSSWLLVRIKGIKRSDVLCSAIKHGTVQT